MGGESLLCRVVRSARHKYLSGGVSGFSGGIQNHLGPFEVGTLETN
jgi:hypothetical protein